MLSYNASNNNSSRREFKKLETILVDGRFSTIIYYWSRFHNYKDSTVDFAND
jgi:hypothetical protein